MKKILSMAIAAAAVAAFADIPSVQIGVTEINSTLTDTIVGVSYADLAAGGDIKVADIVKTKNLTAGDILYVFDGNAYSAWVLEGTDVLTWTAMAVASGGPVVAGQGAENATLAVGKAIFLHRNTPKGSFYVYGAVKAAQPVALAAGRNLVANTTQAAATPSIPDAAKGDMIIIADGTTYNYGKRGWVTVVHDDSGNIETVQGLPEIPAGQGFWYIAGGARTLQW